MTIAYDLDGDPVDSFTREGARRIAAQIARYWRDRGKSVNIVIIPVDGRMIHRSLWQMYCVRSNLINGLPR